MPEPVEIDYDELGQEMQKAIDNWEEGQKPGDPLSGELLDGFEYGFEMGWRIAKGEVIG